MVMNSSSVCDFWGYYTDPSIIFVYNPALLEDTSNSQSELEDYRANTSRASQSFHLVYTYIFLHSWEKNQSAQEIETAEKIETRHRKVLTSCCEAQISLPSHCCFVT